MGNNIERKIPAPTLDKVILVGHGSVSDRCRSQELSDPLKY